MSFYIPDPRFEMPELLVPKRKPTGPMEIDWSHPLTKNLIFNTIITEPLPRDLVTGIAPTVQNTGTQPEPTFATGLHGFELQGTRDATNNDTIQYDFSSNPIGTSGVGKTIAVFAKINDIATDYLDVFEITYNSGADIITWLLHRLQSSNDAGLYDSQAGTAIIQGPVTYGSYHVWTVRGTSGLANWDLYRDGVNITGSVTGNTLAKITVAIEKITLMNSYSYPNESFNGSLVACWVWDDYKSDEFIRQHALNPYQFLIPK